MVYEIHNGTTNTDPAIWQLEYVNYRNWTKTLIQDPNDPAASGSTDRFLNTTLTITRLGTIDPVTGKPLTIITEYPDEPVAPEPWLLFGKDLELYERGYLSAENPDEATITFTLDGTAPCSDDDAFRPESCDTSGVYSIVEETVYTTAVQPPLTVMFSSTVDGESVTLIEAVELSATVDGEQVSIR